VPLPDSRELRFEKAMWLNGELFLELRRGRFHLRPYVGVARRIRDKPIRLRLAPSAQTAR